MLLQGGENMDSRVIKLYKVRKRIRGYIMSTGLGDYLFCTGKPSDATCICWSYRTIEEAEKCAEDHLSCWLGLSAVMA